jgi:hypothetical protein
MFITGSILRRLAAGLLLLGTAGLAACSTCPHSGTAQCGAPKPGVITSVNQTCVMMPEDPVDPAIVREYKGQRVGFCCTGCIPRWDRLTEAQKDAKLARAVAKVPE